MIRKHIDLIAIALLLTAFSFYSHARTGIMLGACSTKATWFSAHYQVPRIVAPAPPRISFARD